LIKRGHLPTTRKLPGWLAMSLLNPQTYLEKREARKKQKSATSLQKG
jgi:hypothetical protein